MPQATKYPTHRSSGVWDLIIIWCFFYMQIIKSMAVKSWMDMYVWHAVGTRVVDGNMCQLYPDNDMQLPCRGH